MKKSLSKIKKELTDVHFLMAGIVGLMLVSTGLFFFFSGNIMQTLLGLVLWSYGLISLGFSVGFNFGKYGK
jgi:multisubunit Na+/H+ antiporter MnhC subunit